MATTHYQMVAQVSSFLTFVMLIYLIAAPLIAVAMVIRLRYYVNDELQVSRHKIIELTAKVDGLEKGKNLKR